jgi:hypothetical protein
MFAITLISAQSAPVNGHTEIAIVCCQTNTGAKHMLARNPCRKDFVRTRMVTIAQTAVATGTIDTGSVCCQKFTNVMIMAESAMWSF